VISGRAELIEAGALDDRGTRESGAIIAKQAERLTHIVKSLLEFSRRKPVERRQQQLRTLCEDAATVLAPLAGRKHTRIEVEGPEVEANVSASDIQQILGHLVTNAIDASPGGGKIRIRTGEERASDHDARPERRVPCATISVTDDGEGIAPDVLPHVFDPFFTTKPVGQGTGLGLSVTYGIVRDHGGWIAVSSAPGVGTRFVMYFPQ
jgi:two-component system NtrC family sensor kinase